MQSHALDDRDTSLSSPVVSSLYPPDCVDLTRLWVRLRSGATRVAASYCSDRYCHLVLDVPGGHAPRRGPLVTDLATLERILLGDSQKTIALDWKCAPSTVTFKATRCLKSLGFGCTAGSIPTALILLAHASRRGLAALAFETSMLPRGGYSRHLVRIQRPDTYLNGLFSPAERDIVELLVEGKTRKEIAELRKTSLRTVANQIGQTYRKVGVSGRIALIGRLLERTSSSRNPSVEWSGGARLSLTEHDARPECCGAAPAGSSDGQPRVEQR